MSAIAKKDKITGNPDKRRKFKPRSPPLDVSPVAIPNLGGNPPKKRSSGSCLGILL
jgi:hypothetical protein